MRDHDHVAHRCRVDAELRESLGGCAQCTRLRRAAISAVKPVSRTIRALGVADRPRRNSPSASARRADRRRGNAPVGWRVARRVADRVDFVVRMASCFDLLAHARCQRVGHAIAVRMCAGARCRSTDASATIHASRRHAGNRPVCTHRRRARIDARRFSMATASRIGRGPIATIRKSPIAIVVVAMPRATIERCRLARRSTLRLREHARAARRHALDQLHAVVARHAGCDAPQAPRPPCSARPRALSRSAVSMPTMPPPMIVTRASGGECARARQGCPMRARP